jgi:Holliday junction DNA helicase RuvA
MFYSLTGKILKIDEQSFAISCGGVGFKCFSTHNTLESLRRLPSDEATVYTHLNVREDALDLFGFYTEQEMDAFKLLITVSGVGPKAALAILSQLTPDSFAIAVSSGDVKAITAANGVGPKLAQRVIMELKDKIGSVSFISDESSVVSESLNAVNSMSNTSEAILALVGLGYSQSEASIAVSKLSPELSVEQLITQALKGMTLRF